MRRGRCIRYYPRFPEAVPGRGAGCPRVTQPFATASPTEVGPAVRLACVRRAASVHPEPGSNSPSKNIWASSPSGPHNCYADRFRSIHMVLLDRKRNFSGPPLGGLAKNESKSDHFKWFDVCPDATHHVCPSSQYPVLKVHALRPIRFDRAARQGDILPDRRAPGGGNLGVHISYTSYDSQLYLPVIKRGPRFRDPLLRLSIEKGFQSLRPAACGQTPQSRQVLHQPRRYPRP